MVTGKDSKGFSIVARRGEADLILYEEIDSALGVSAKRIRDELAALGNVSTIHVRINSPGGQVLEGLGIYNTLKEHKARIVVHIDGMALSMASVIAMAGDEIRAAKSAFIMIHNPVNVAYGDADDLRHSANLLDKTRDQLAAIYAKRSKQPVEKLLELMDAESWFDASEALALGIIDRITDDPAVEASFDPGRFHRVPDRFQAMCKSTGNAGNTAGKGTNMSTGTTTTVDRDQIVKEERECVAKIQAACEGINVADNGTIANIRARAIAGEISFEDFQSGLLTAMRDSRPTGPAVHTGNGRARGPEVLEAALAIHLGRESVAEKAYGAQTCQVARDRRFRHVMDIVRATFEFAGRDVPRDEREMLRAAGGGGFSTYSLPGIFSNVANKFAIDAYQAIPSVARRVCRIVSANDFKTATGIQLGASVQFEELAPDGEIKHGTLSEATMTYKVDTFAKMLGVTRKDLVNDDLGALADIPVLLSRGAALKLESLFFTLFLNNAAVFTTARGNLLDAPLGIEGLKAGYNAMAKLTDTNDDPILVRPGFILTPSELAIDARELVGSPVKITGTGGTMPVMNGLYNLAEPVDSPYLSNDDYSGASETGWYLLADPGTVAIAVLAYLQGQQFPTIEAQDTDFDTLGMRFRGYHDFGVAWADWRGGVKSTGDAQQ